MDPLEFDESRRFAADPRPRVLVVLAQPAPLGRWLEVLAAEGFAAEGLGDPAKLIETIDRFAPELVAIGESFPRVSGRQLALSLRARGRTFALPVVGLLEGPELPTLVRWLSVGAVDGWRAGAHPDLARRARGLLEECRLTQAQTKPLAARFLAYARRTSLSGTALVYAETPFEGRARFEDGTLTEAYFGELRGPSALGQLLELDDSPLEWIDREAPTAPIRLPAAARHPGRVLVVEDVGLLGAQLRDALAGAGFEVEVATDGRAGLQAALTARFDVALVDLNLPVLDGWGLLRQLKEDPVARETAVLVLSAQDAQVETLKAARAGARAWLKKSGRAKELLDAVALLARPRGLAWAALASLEVATLELRSIGPVWLLRALAELDCRGRLFVEDELSRFELKVSHGHLASAVAQVGSRRLHGPAAIQALLGSRGTGTFEPRETPLPLSAPWIYEVVQSACDAVTLESTRALERALTRPRELFFSQELCLLFARVATAREIEVMDAFAREPRSVEELALEVRQPPEEVRAALIELLRRGVLSTEPP